MKTEALHMLAKQVTEAYNFLKSGVNDEVLGRALTKVIVDSNCVLWKEFRGLWISTMQRCVDLELVALKEIRWENIKPWVPLRSNPTQPKALSEKL